MPKTPICLTLQKPEISTGFMGHLARKRISFKLYSVPTKVLLVKIVCNIVVCAVVQLIQFFWGSIKTSFFEMQGGYKKICFYK